MIQQGTEYYMIQAQYQRWKLNNEFQKAKHTSYNDASMAHKSVLFSNPKTTRRNYFLSFSSMSEMEIESWNNYRLRKANAIIYADWW